ncbi:glycosyltransferase family 4 protein [Halobaculum rubrum]|uniref:glycosyltransferase family 4 protein n=1 Tax=Halobaculum rubrum TaxID=2872158 RepID=UPI001CA40DF4|nr:glycosyltransferase family 4 protein [Halobaculum rubrum]QZX99905.1 glycosyltransferase family 4 protein [Halobaculum rubrum]
MTSETILLLGRNEGGGEATFLETVDELLESDDTYSHTFQSESSEGIHKTVLEYFNLLRWKFLFPEPEPLYSDENLSDYDIVHAHSNPVVLKDSIDVPFVYSASASNYHYLRDYYEWSESKIERRHAVARVAYKLLQLHDRALNTGAVDRLLIWTEFPKEYYTRIGYSEDQIDVIYPSCRDFGDGQTPHNGTNVLFVGKGGRKGAGIAVDAFQNVRSGTQELTLHYYHPPGEQPDYAGEGVRLHEYVPHEKFRTEVLPKMDILVSPTKYESYGYTLVEAQSHGIPVVATDLPVTRDILGKGALLPSRDRNSFTRALDSLVSDPTYRAEMGNRARANYEARFTTAAFRQRLYDSYDRAMD